MVILISKSSEILKGILKICNTEIAPISLTFASVRKANSQTQGFYLLELMLDDIVEPAGLNVRILPQNPESSNSENDNPFGKTALMICIKQN